MGRKVAIFFVLGATLAALLSSAPASASTATDETEFVRLINGARASRGLSALSVRSDLTDVARRHAAKMAASGSIYHNKQLGSQVSGWSELGENVGTGPYVDEIHDAFMDSSPHRANILHATYNQVGIGVAVSEKMLYVVEVFARRTAPAPARKASSAQRSGTATTFRLTPAAPKVVAARRQAPIAAVRLHPAPVRTVSMLAELASFDSLVSDRTTPSLAPQEA